MENKETQETNVVEQSDTTTQTTTEETKGENVVDKETTKEVEETTTKEAEEETDVDVDFDDDEEEEKETKSAEVDKKKNSRDTNRKYAKLRREARNEGILETLNHKNPYTNETMASDEDIELYQTQKKMEAEGLDPLSLTDYRNFINRQAKAEKEEQEKQAKEQAERTKVANERMEKDFSEFNEKYKDVKISEYLKDNKDRKDTINALIGAGLTLTQAYETIQRLENKNTIDKATQIAQKQMQNSVASVGSLTDGEEVNDNVDIWGMSDEEFHKYQEKRRLGN